MTIVATMKAVVLIGHGGPEMLQWREDIPVPVPGANEVLVQVSAAGMNNTDINTRIGWYAPEVTGATDQTVDQEVESGGWDGALQFPRIQGGDLCGRIVAVGNDVDMAIGTRVTAPLCLPRPTLDNPVGLKVIGSEMDGAFAQYCVLEARDVFDVRASPLSDVEIAAIPCAYGTAEGLLMRAGVRKGQNVLITGASGGVGMAAVQLACLRGAVVTAITSPAKAEAVRAAGASHILERGAVPQKASYDVAIDVVGGDSFGDLIRALRPGGHYAVSGAIAGPIVAADLREIYLPDITLHGSTYQPPEVFERLVKLMNEGAFRPLVSRTYPLRDIGRAQTDFMSKTLPGKLVLIPPQEGA
ncbi:alcohol dehydrogenase family protein [Shimia sp.]|uniref:alcohol dehydrogenase family protein n=1 Tax=Shimia sp. TaxID=1954381 RepID=UPI003296E43B